MIRRPALFLLLGAAVALVPVGCKRSSETPTTPGPVTPTPTPAPAPTPTPTPVAACPLPASSNPSNDCGPWGSHLTGQLYDALDATMQEHPELFNFNDLNGGNPKVLDRIHFHEAVKAELAKQGICTMITEEEIAIKNTNSFSEDWSIYTSTGYVRRRYRGTCTPAWF